jgi:pyridoxal phosphate enzyme (YggS family)
MAVTKTVPPETIRLALAHGLYLLGESRVQEALAKFGADGQALNTATGKTPELHLIGHLQTNKAKQAAQLFDWVQSIDKAETAQELDKWAARFDQTINILLEVNTSGEESKYGFRSDQGLFDCIAQIKDLPRLKMRGLMTIGPLTTAEAQIRSAFKRLAALLQELKHRYPQFTWDTLSMGMSSDFELAIEEGATLVRLGTILFGERESR